MPGKASVYNDKLTNIDNRVSLMKYLQNIELGDIALVEIAKFINMIKPASFKLFRMNSDEFVLISEKQMREEELGDTASSIISFFDQMDIEVSDSIELVISISIGIAVGNSNETLNQAKIAIKELREHKRGSYKIFDPESSYIKKQEENIYWIHKKKNAFIEENLTAFYQPIINNKTKKIEKYECLVRIYEDDVLVPPIRFMEASVLTGTLALVTKTVIKKSFETFSDTNYEFSINITNTDLYSEYLEAYLMKYVQMYDIDPSRVVLEILEDIDTLNTTKILNQLNSLRERGFKLAIDDFGSQSSNFSRLLEFSPDYLKIDGSFIKNILTDAKSMFVSMSVSNIIFFIFNS